MATPATSVPISSSDPGNYDVPWRIALPSDGDELERGVITRNQTMVAHPAASDLDICFEDAYMRRIVACVNACAGFRIEELEAMQLGDLAVLFYEIRAQRTELRKVQG